MTAANYQKLVWDAKILADMIQILQNRLHDMFFKDFVELDEEERKLRIQQPDIPF